MKIYTKKGDKGITFLADGSLHGKEEVIYGAIGTIDELNSWVGLVSSVGAGLRPAPWGGSSDPPLRKIQDNLFSINAILAKAKNIKFDVKCETKFLEKEIDKMEKELPALKNFILPGGHELAATLHLARTVCRRCERTLVRYQRVNTMAREFIPYFNRLSDYFFTRARWVNYKSEIKDVIWQR